MFSSGVLTEGQLRVRPIGLGRAPVAGGAGFLLAGGRLRAAHAGFSDMAAYFSSQERAARAGRLRQTLSQHDVLRGMRPPRLPSDLLVLPPLQGRG